MTQRLGIQLRDFFGLIRLPLQKPVVGRLALYEGYYCPHWETGHNWEIGHIQIRVSRFRKVLVYGFVLAASCGLFFAGYAPGIMLLFFSLYVVCLIAMPARERWKPIFPPDFYLDETWDLGGTVEFEGEVGPGKDGFPNREVKIHRVIRFRNRPPMPDLTKSWGLYR